MLSQDEINKIETIHTLNMELHLYKDKESQLYKLAQTADSLIIETDQFDLIDDTGNVYNFNSTDNLYKGKVSVHTEGFALKFDILAQQEVVICTVPSFKGSAYSDKKQFENTISNLKNCMIIRSKLERTVNYLERKCSVYRTTIWTTSIISILIITFMAIY